ncbi:MAG: hypothetical protein ACOC2W_04780, partial [bacterium]
RSKDLKDYADTLTSKVKPVKITVDGMDFTLNNENIVVFNDTPTSVNLNIFGDERLISPEIAWEYDDIKNDFTEDVDEVDLSFDELDDNTIDNSNDYINEKQPFSLNLDFELQMAEGDQTTNQDDWLVVDVSGNIPKDRRTAVNLLRLLKDFGQNHGGNVKEAIDVLTVNDLYNK